MSMRPKKSPAPGLRRSASASATVISTYSLVISSAALCGIDVLEPLDHEVTRLAGERQARPFQFELREHVHCVPRPRSAAAGRSTAGASSLAPVRQSGRFHSGDRILPTGLASPSVTENDPEAPVEPVDADDEELIEDELIVEEISIDGMCGVY